MNIMRTCQDGRTHDRNTEPRSWFLRCEACRLLKAYGVRAVQADKFGGDWPPEQFKKRGITYEPAARPKSDFYRDLLPVINSRRIELLDHPRLVQ